MKYLVQVSYTNPAHEHVSLRRRVDTVNRIVEAANEEQAILRVSQQQRALGFMVKEANVVKTKAINEDVKEEHPPEVVAFASHAHEQWRKGFDPEGEGKERIKKNSDGSEGNINESSISYNKPKPKNTDGWSTPKPKPRHTDGWSTPKPKDAGSLPDYVKRGQQEFDRQTKAQNKKPVQAGTLAAKNNMKKEEVEEMYETSMIGGKKLDPKFLVWKQTGMNHSDAVSRHGKENVKIAGKNRFGEPIVHVKVPLGEEMEQVDEGKKGKVTIRYEPDLGKKQKPAGPPPQKAIEKNLRNTYGKGTVTIEPYDEYHLPDHHIATHETRDGETNSHLIVPPKHNGGHWGIEASPLSTSNYYGEEVEQIDEVIKTANPGRGYHGEHPADKADAKYAEMHRKLLKTAVAGNSSSKKIRNYLDSTHGRHLAGRENDSKYIAKDFAKFDRSYKPEMFKEEVEYIEEKLTLDDPVSKWISDFVHSDNPRFEGKSRKKRIEMALGAYYAAKNEAVEKYDQTEVNAAKKKQANKNGSMNKLNMEPEMEANIQGVK